MRFRVLAWLAFAAALIALVVVVRASSETRAGAASAAAARDYWVIEYRRRWRLERRDGRARAATIRALRASLRAVPRPSRLEAQFMCLHRFEGPWDDAGAPYFGGLQMDVDFMAAYGRPYLDAWGTANHWPVSVQIAVAMRGYLERGFQPWPVTRRACGL